MTTFTDELFEAIVEEHAGIETHGIGDRRSVRRPTLGPCSVFHQ